MAALPALAALAALLSEAMAGAAATYSGKAGVPSRDHHHGDRHAAPSSLASAAEATARPLCGKPVTNAGVERPAGSDTAGADRTDDPPAARSRRRGRAQVEERRR